MPKSEWGPRPSTTDDGQEHAEDREVLAAKERKKRKAKLGERREMEGWNSGRMERRRNLSPAKAFSCQAGHSLRFDKVMRQSGGQSVWKGERGQSRIDYEEEDD